MRRLIVITTAILAAVICGISAIDPDLPSPAPNVSIRSASWRRCARRRPAPAVQRFRRVRPRISAQDETFGQRNNSAAIEFEFPLRMGFGGLGRHLVCSTPPPPAPPAPDPESR